MNKVSVEPDKKHAIPLALLLFVTLAAEGILRLLLQLYLAEGGASRLIISLNTSLFWLGILIGSTLWGALSDHRSTRLLLCVVLGTCALTTGSLALQLPWHGTLAIVFVRALAFGGLVPISMAATSRSSSSRNRGTNLSHAVSPRPLGSAVGALIGGFVLQVLGFRGGFLLSGAFFLLVLPAAFQLPGGAGVRARARSPSPSSLLLVDGMAYLYVAAIFAQMAVMGSFSLIYVHMQTLAIPARVMGALSAIGPAVAIPGCLLFGRLADRVSRKVIFVVGFAFTMAVPAAFALAQGVWGLAAGYMLFGLSFSSMYLGTTAYIGDVVPRERQGQMLGLFESSRALGGVLGPLVAGAIAAPLGFQGMCLVLAGIGTVGFLLVSRRVSR